mmetsp:Transcript_24348/g.79616  ORF Transcript_24348/g.79616 Transcript_24348/m.79616 type:complete len:439 (-) Transcript_24348:108-1424(-)
MRQQTLRAVRGTPCACVHGRDITVGENKRSRREGGAQVAKRSPRTARRPTSRGGVPRLRRASSDVDDARQLLQPVEEQVALLDRRVELGRLLVGPRRRDDQIHLVDLAREPLRRDEAGELLVEEVRRDSEGGRHAGEGDGAVRLEELVVREHPQLPPVEARVRVQVPVGVERVDDPDERLHQRAVAALVQPVEQVGEVRDLAQHLQDLGRVDDLALEVGARQRQQRRGDGVQHERVVRDQLRRGEGRDRVEEEVGRLLERACRDVEDRLVHLEPVPPLPVPALVQQALGSVDGVRGQLLVVEEEGEPQLGKEEVELRAEADRLGVRLLQRRERLSPLPDPHQELRLCQHRAANLRLPLALLGRLDRVAQPRQLRRVGRLQLREQSGIRLPAERLAGGAVEGRHLLLLDLLQQLRLERRFVGHGGAAEGEAELSAVEVV